MMQAIQFGAGNIGRGFLGQLFFETGYETTFVDVAPEIVTGLRTRREYPLRIVGDTPRTLIIAHCTAVHGADIEAAATALAEADLAATAVGVNALPKIAPTLARGIAKRFERPDAPPLNIIVCENLIDAGPFLHEQVRQHLPHAFHAALDAQVGCVEASIGRMVPLTTEAMKAEDPLLICAEEYCELPVDAHGFRGPIPPLNNMAPRSNFKAYVERKLFVHNAGHAATAYLGYLRGHEYIWQAIEDETVRAEADAATAETCAGLAAKHDLPPDEIRAHWLDLVRRFGNKALGDQVVRVAADPLRKLGPRDRLVGAGLMCLGQGIEPVHVAFAAAAAIRYDHPKDPAAQRLQEIRRDHGMRGVFAQVCQIPEESHLAQLISQGTQRLQREGWVS
jgi:mannitol-1-phosphate 5-dehydrogenase